ncbi:DUF6880 family protein [Rhizobium leguminosarum]|uniref:DUF6880 family protein n=1 Tax=Rhizobium leguminosarum TaxID=384 RepID=UPI001AE3A694|nr:DUF6880 family protein [Rhizobium leguminosarum]MBP2443166.1 hypothetical protein [Rhizobium leguminosarum]
MAAKTTLNAKNLESLGAQRLAVLLIEISTGSAAHKRRLRMELAGNHGSVEIAREVRKRLASIARARTFINWHKVKALKSDLETQRKTITETVAADNPEEAFELIWQLLALADSIFERSKAGSESLIQSFQQACEDAGVIAASAKIEIAPLADRVFRAVQNDGYGLYENLIAAMTPALGHAGLDRVKNLLVQWSEEPEDKPAEDKHEVIGWGSAGPIYEDEIYATSRELTVRIALQEIADVQGDVDAYIALQPAETRKVPTVAAEIADRLLKAGRAKEAFDALGEVDTRSRGDMPLEWQLAHVATLEALGRADEAQAYRWACFEQSLHHQHLKAFLKRLPDFDDIEAEEKAFAHAQAFPDIHRALAFYLNWPAPAEAAKLVIRRKAELDGDLYELMPPAAEALAEKHPLAATFVLRSMIDFTLDSGRSSRYKYAARHLADCASFAPHIDDFGNAKSHDAYVADLKRRHGKKHGFWSLLP